MDSEYGECENCCIVYDLFQDYHDWTNENDDEYDENLNLCKGCRSNFN